MSSHGVDWSALAQRSQMLCRTATEGHLIELAVEAVQAIGGAEAVALWLYDPAGGGLRLAAQLGLKAASGTRPDWAGMVKLPLGSGRQLIGVLEAYTNRAEGFEPEVEQAVQILGAQVATAIYRLRETARADVAKVQAVDRGRLAELELLSALTEAAGAVTDYRELFGTLLATLPATVPCDAALLLSGGDGGVAGLARFGPAAHLGLLAPLLEGAVEALTTAGVTCGPLDPAEVELLGPPAATDGAASLRHGLGLPLFRQGAIDGLIYLAAVGEEGFTETQAAVLRRFVGQVCASLDRLQDYQAVEIERLATIINSLPQGVVLLDAEGQILLENRPGTARIELLNGPGPVVTRLGAWPLSELLEAAMASGIDLIRREIQICPGGQIYHFAVTVVAVRDGAELVGTVLSIEDVTELRQTEQRLFHDARLASIGEFASGLAHELNNPMMIILGIAEILGDEPALAGDKQELLAEMETATFRAAEIVKQLMVFADQQRDAGWDSLALDEILHQAIPLVAAQCERDGVRIELDWDETVPLVQGNAGKLQQIVLNLLRNAFEAITQSGTGGVITLRGSHRPGFVDLDIRDDGPGIPPGLEAKIFDVFFTTKRDYQGKGLGLSVAHRLAVEHGGNLTVSTPPEGGANFRLTLPIPTSV